MTVLLHDVHIGAQRKAGTTPLTKATLASSILTWFATTVQGLDDDLVILGDLFDDFEVDNLSVLATFHILKEFCDRGHHLTLIPGNHDWSPRGDKMSSFHFLAGLLQSVTNTAVIGTEGLQWVADHLGCEVWTIPHMPNQTLFDMAIEEAAKVATEDQKRYLLLHANCMNHFANNSDHSLNVSEGQMDALLAAGWDLIFAHEHQAKTYRNRRVVVVGNQIPSSVADCLGNDTKHYVRITDGGTLEFTQTWEAAGSFAQVPWTELSEYDGPEQFIRVIGEVEGTQASTVIDAIAKFRQRSQAYVVTNAVVIHGVEVCKDLGEITFENVSKFDVMAALKRHLTEKEFEVVEDLVQDQKEDMKEAA